MDSTHPTLAQEGRASLSVATVPSRFGPAASADLDVSGLSATILLGGLVMSLEIDSKTKVSLENLIRHRLGEGLGADVEVVSIAVEANRLEIVIDVYIGAEAEPTAVAERFFGLTSQVRNTLGDRWRDFYPVITPNFDDRLHA